MKRHEQRSRLRVLMALSLASVACSTVIGADFDDKTLVESDAAAGGSAGAALGGTGGTPTGGTGGAPTGGTGGAPTGGTGGAPTGGTGGAPTGGTGGALTGGTGGALTGGTGGAPTGGTGGAPTGGTGGTSTGGTGGSSSSIRCGSTLSCAAATQNCCIGGGNPAACSATTCPALTLPCDDRSDCAAKGFPGTVCCGSPNAGGSVTAVSCVAFSNCAAPKIVLCDTSTSTPCPDGGTCQPTSVSNLNGYKECK